MCPGALSSERNGTMGAVQDQKGTVVVVDDEPNIADLVDLYLAREGFRVLKTGTGEAGLQAVKDHRPRLVVLDVGLPDVDGLEGSCPDRRDDCIVLGSSERGHSGKDARGGTGATPAPHHLLH